ncbi:hypothetical protein DAI22_11g230540 [Oryza sativa Japonica Group]|nr:hypothetical protein DAI22_11g230540 [Oryza sativa Japonica Group]
MTSLARRIARSQQRPVPFSPSPLTEAPAVAGSPSLVTTTIRDNSRAYAKINPRSHFTGVLKSQPPV